MSKVRLRAPLCAGHMLMSNGQGIAAGGTTDYSPWKGSKALYTFDFGSEKFVRQQNMVDGRWYPTVVNTRGGYALIVGGFNSSGANSKTSEVYIPWTRTYDTRPGNREFPPYPHIFLTADARYFFTGAGWAKAPEDVDSSDHVRPDVLDQRQQRRTRVVMMSPASPTHSFDANQRSISVEYAAGKITINTTSSLAPLATTGSSR